MQISSIFHLDITHISIHISSRYHPHIIQISPTYRPNITRSIFFTTPQLGEKSSLNPDLAQLLPVKTPLLNSIKTPLIIQILPKYHPEITQKSSRYHPDIIQISSRYHPDIIQKSSIYNLGEKSSFNPCMARL